MQIRLTFLVVIAAPVPVGAVAEDGVAANATAPVTLAIEFTDVRVKNAPNVRLAFLAIVAAAAPVGAVAKLGMPCFRNQKIAAEALLVHRSSGVGRSYFP